MYSTAELAKGLLYLRQWYYGVEERIVLSGYGQGVRVYGLSRDLCTNLVLCLRGLGLSVFGATENTGRTRWDCKLLSGLSTYYVNYEGSVELTLL